MKNILILITLILGLVSCGEYQKLVKSDDYQLIYKKSIEYYNAKKYQRALNLLENIRNVFSGTSKAQAIAYYRAFCNYRLNNYQAASGLFAQFIKNYPESSYAEECLFMIGYCSYQASPRARLDQQVTEKALREFQLYLDRYPDSQRKASINIYMDELNDKLAYKAYLSAKNYYHREHYKSAIISLRNCLKDFPSSKHREEVMYMIFISSHEMAVNSIVEKQVERYNDALEEFYVFTEEFPESVYTLDLQNREKNIKTFLENVK